MNKTHKNAILIIIVSAILVAILYNYKFIFYMLELLETNRLSELSDGEMIRIHVGWVTFIYHILLFCITAFFNYSWKDKLIHHGMPKTCRILLIVMINLLIFYGAAFTEHIFMNRIFEGLSKRLTTEYFLFANISISGLAVSVAYFIILLRKIFAFR